MAATRTTKKARIVSDAHKAAMAQGRDESRAVSAYLEALAAHAPKRGRKRTSESIDRRLAAIEASIGAASPMSRLSLIQERLDLEAEQSTLSNASDITDVEDRFVEVASSYSARKGISYAAWRELGVPAAALRRAGVSRAS
jgi:hypothetical protein